MPFLNHKLVTQALQSSQASSDKLTPILFDSRSASAISAPRINVNAGAVDFTPVDPPKIVLDTRLESAAELSKVLVNSALKYQDTVDTLTAEERLLKTELAIRETTNGYLQTQTGKAVEQFDAFRSNIEQQVSSAIQEVPESVRAKMAPSLAKLRQSMIASGADHKVKQTSAWQEEILKAKEVSARQQLIDTSDKPEQFMAVVGQHLQVIGAQPNKSKEAILAEQDKFYSDILGDAITMHLSRGKAEIDMGASGSTHFDKAAQFIEIGASKEFKADGVMLAKASAALGSALAEANTARRTREREEAHRVKDAREQAAKDITMKALATGNGQLLNSISDPELRAKSLGWFNNIQSGVETSPQAMLSFLNRLDEIGSTTELINTGVKLGVHPAKIVEFSGKLESLRKEDKEDVLSDIKRFAHAMVPGGDAFDKFERPQEQQQFNAIFMRLLDKTSRRPDGVPISVALQDAKAEIFNDPNYHTNFGQVVLNREIVAAAQIDGIPNKGMLALDKVAGLSEEVKLPTGKSVSRIDYEYSLAAQAVLKKYQVFGLSKEDFLARLSQNNDLYTSFSVDMANLAMQRRYYLELAATREDEAKAKAKKTSTSKSTDKSNKGY